MATVPVFVSRACARDAAIADERSFVWRYNAARQFARVSCEPRNAGCETVCEFAEMQTMRLPAAELIEQGLRDLALGYETDASLLVPIGAPRLAALGLAVPTPLADPQEGLYRWLRHRYGNSAHSQFRTLVRRLVCYERAMCVR